MRGQREWGNGLLLARRCDWVWRGQEPRLVGRGRKCGAFVVGRDDGPRALASGQWPRYGANRAEAGVLRLDVGKRAGNGGQGWEVGPLMRMRGAEAAPLRRGW